MVLPEVISGRLIGAGFAFTAPGVGREDDCSHCWFHPLWGAVFAAREGTSHRSHGGGRQLESPLWILSWKSAPALCLSTSSGAETIRKPKNREIAIGPGVSYCGHFFSASSMENTSLHDPFYVKEDFFRTVLYLLLEPRPAYFLSYPAYLNS